jgi:very-short-patch-repair endonuclease
MHRKNLGQALTKEGTILKYLEDLRPLLKINRKNNTESEGIVWQLIRNKNLCYKFTRQKPIGRFIIDFYCSQLLLAIEVDGGYHQQRKYQDQERDKYLEHCQIKTIRILNMETNDIGFLKKKLLREIEFRLSELSK